jgi:hypothetical protein
MNRASKLTGVLAAVAILIAGCQTFTPPEPATPTEAVAIVYASIEATAKATTARLEAGGITADQAADVEKILVQADAIADTAAAALAAGRPDDATTYLSIATGILNDLERSARR